MSKNEKLFWLSIGILAVFWLTLKILTYIKIEQLHQDNNISTIQNKPIVKSIIKIIDDNQAIRKNLEKYQSIKQINKSLNLKIIILNETIDKQINQAFNLTYKNIDTFLDFHYSVIGEYSEMLGTVTHKIDALVKEKLFGDMFWNQLKQAQQQINQQYKSLLQEHFHQVYILATDDINQTLNNKIFFTLSEDINKRTSLQTIKFASFIGFKGTIKMISIVSSKIIEKTILKLATKSAIKTTSKTASSGVAAMAGLSCGPFAWACSPILAGMVWFGTDAIVISADEYINRDEFKYDIVNMIDKQKQDLINHIKISYSKEFKNDSKTIENMFKTTIIKKQTIIEKIIK